MIIYFGFKVFHISILNLVKKKKGFILLPEKQSFSQLTMFGYNYETIMVIIYDNYNCKIKN